MNPSVGRILRNDGSSVTFTLGLVQGGELVASRAAAMVKSAHDIVLHTDKRLTANRRRTALGRRRQRLNFCRRHERRSPRKMHAGGVTDPSTNRNHSFDPNGRSRSTCSNAGAAWVWKSGVVGCWMVGRRRRRPWLTYHSNS